MFHRLAARGLQFLAATIPGILPATVAAQEQVQLTEAQQSLLNSAEERGALLYRYDQAAWHGTDAFLQQFDTQRDGEIMRGYVIVKGEDNLLDAIFFGEVSGELTEVARYTVDGSRVVSRVYHDVDARPPLSPLARRLAHVRQVAINAAVSEQIGLCTDGAPNTVVLPPDADGSIDVYLLTPPVQMDSYPLGGHYLFEIAADDSVVSWRRFLNSCFTLPTSRNTDRGEAVGTLVTHLLDPQPTEIHFFASHYMQLRLFVGTSENDLMWPIEAGESMGAMRTSD